jgi:UDP-N-acetylglucosamine:LPS N-acetylglucosamine transferase
MGIEGEHLLVSGRPEDRTDEMIGSVRCVGHMNAEELSSALLHAQLIVSRSGYTTLMDLHHLGLGALLVPTPGQPEQEYLAELHGTTGRFIVQRQDQLDLKEALEKGTHATGPSPVDGSALDGALNELSALIAARRSPASATTATFAR